MAKLNVKKGDNVLILTGKDNGKVAEVLECFPEENKVTVKGINVIVKHNKPRSAQDKGGITKKEGKIQVGNVMVVCPSCNKATRVSVATGEDGKRVRVCKKCGAVLDSGAKKPTAKKAAKADEAKVEAKPSTKAASETKTASKKASTTAKTASTAKKTGGK